MKKLNALLTVSAAVLTMNMSVATAEIRLGLDFAPYPPFAEKGADGEQSGFEIELGEAICAAMDETCVWTPVAWDGIIPALLEKKIDAIFASMSITEERMKVIDFSDKYYNTPAILVAPKSSDISDDPASTKGKIIGVQVSTTHSNYADKYFSNTADSIKTYQAFDEHNNDLVAGRVDAVIGDSIAFGDFLGSDAGKDFEKKVELNDDAIFGPGVGVGLRKEDSEMKAKINAAIAQVREDGTYDAIAKKYFDFNIFGE